MTSDLTTPGSPAHIKEEQGKITICCIIVCVCVCKIESIIRLLYNSNFDPRFGYWDLEEHLGNFKANICLGLCDPLL